MKKTVQEYYDNYGWQKDKTGEYGDSIAFVDSRKHVLNYLNKAVLRVAEHYKHQGTYLLDAASGAYPMQACSTFYKHHVCLDLSLTGLKEAKKRLEKGLFVMGDVTSLPFKNEIFGGVISANTLYHIDANQQESAVSELYRVLEKSGVLVILYSNGKHALYRYWHRNLGKAILRLTGLKYLKNIFVHETEEKHTSNKKSRTKPRLYFHAFPISWFESTLKKLQIKNFTISCYYLLHYKTTKKFIPNNFLGKGILHMISWLEDSFPEKLASWGQYTKIITHKE